MCNRILPMLAFLLGIGLAAGTLAFANTITEVHGDGVQIVRVKDDKTGQQVRCAVIKIQSDGHTGAGINCEWPSR